MQLHHWFSCIWKENDTGHAFFPKWNKQSRNSAISFRDIIENTLNKVCRHMLWRKHRTQFANDVCCLNIFVSALWKLIKFAVHSPEVMWSFSSQRFCSVPGMTECEAVCANGTVLGNSVDGPQTLAMLCVWIINYRLFHIDWNLFIYWSAVYPSKNTVHLVRITAFSFSFCVSVRKIIGKWIDCQ